MIRRLLYRQISMMERKLGASMDEMRYVVDHALRPFWRLSTLQLLADYHRKLPAAAYYVAKLAAYRQEDCGSCLRIATHLARKNGVPDALIRAAVSGNVDGLPKELRPVYRFARQQSNRIDDPDLREWIRRQYGDEALVELAIAIASARMFPALKRTVGYATACSLARKGPVAAVDARE